jgi:peptide/nickel transport system substrate-binding protein
MRARGLLIASLAAIGLATAACGGSGGSAPPTASGGAGSGSGASGATTTSNGPGKPMPILRIGTTNYIDSLNPFNYIEAQSTVAFDMLYPYLIQTTHGRVYEGDWAQKWDVSPDGKTYTFHLRPGATWSDGVPATADDAAWMINTIVKYQDGPAGTLATEVGHIATATAPDANTLVVNYDKPIANAIYKLSSIPILPKHVYQPLEGTDGKGLKTFKPEQHGPVVSAGPYTLATYQPRGTTVYKAYPKFYGEPKPLQQAVTLTFYTTPDPMLADLKAGKLDYVDQVPTNAVTDLKADPNVVVTEKPGDETFNITWNSNPWKPKHRELLDPKVKQALSMTVDRQRIINVVFNGHASLVESFVGHTAGEWENPNLGPLKYDIAAANAQLDALGYKRGPDGIRVVPATTGKYAEPAHKMVYDIMTPTSTDFNVDREFEIIKAGFEQAGVHVTQVSGGDSTAAYAYETGDNCDFSKKKGYDQKFDIALWDWFVYSDPDDALSYVTSDQWCSWSDTGYSNPTYDAQYNQQSTLLDKAARKTLVDQMQQTIYDNVLYTQLGEEDYIDARSKSITGTDVLLNGYSKRFYTEIGKAS